MFPVPTNFQMKNKRSNLPANFYYASTYTNQKVVYCYRNLAITTIRKTYKYQ